MPLAIKNTLLLLFSACLAVVINFWTSAVDAGKSPQDMVYGVLAAIIVIGQILFTVCVKSYEEQKIALLNEAQDVKFQTAIQETLALSKRLQDAIARGDHQEVIRLSEWRARLGR